MVDRFWSERGMDCGIIEEEPEYERLSDDAVNTLADMVFNREVFGSWQITEDAPVSIEQVFVFLMLMDEITLKRVLRDGTNYLYEHLNEAEAVAVNGYPVFYSCRWIDTVDFERVMNRVRQLESNQA